MAKLPAFEPIEFLVARKFGLSSGFGAEGRARSDPKLAKEIAIYEERLVTLSPEEFKALLESERAKQQAEHAAKLEREERERFFHQPYAEADIDHWSKAAHWTLDEAIALSFGKAPERVSWERIKPLTEISAFAGHYHRRRDLALRAMTWQQLFDPVLPGIFLAWAKRKRTSKLSASYGKSRNSRHGSIRCRVSYPLRRQRSPWARASVRAC
jgi:hypothetical protein